jgi:hypothetical protein
MHAGVAGLTGHWCAASGASMLARDGLDKIHVSDDIRNSNYYDD